MPLATADTFPTTSLRVTQVTVDVLRNTDPNVLVTRVSTDVLRNVDSNVRVTKVGVEVLRTTAFGEDYTRQRDDRASRSAWSAGSCGP
jgi:hypothetical protein